MIPDKPDRLGSVRFFYAGSMNNVLGLERTWVAAVDPTHEGNWWRLTGGATDEHDSLNVFGLSQIKVGVKQSDSPHSFCLFDFPETVESHGIFETVERGDSAIAAGELPVPLTDLCSLVDDMTAGYGIVVILDDELAIFQRGDALIFVKAGFGIRAHHGFSPNLLALDHDQYRLVGIVATIRPISKAYRALIAATTLNLL